MGGPDFNNINYDPYQLPSDDDQLIKLIVDCRPQYKEADEAMREEETS